MGKGAARAPVQAALPQILPCKTLTHPHLTPPLPTPSLPLLPTPPHPQPLVLSSVGGGLTKRLFSKTLSLESESKSLQEAKGRGGTEEVTGPRKGQVGDIIPGDGVCGLAGGKLRHQHTLVELSLPGGAQAELRHPSRGCKSLQGLGSRSSFQAEDPLAPCHLDALPGQPHPGQTGANTCQNRDIRGLRASRPCCAVLSSCLGFTLFSTAWLAFTPFQKRMLKPQRGASRPGNPHSRSLCCRSQT